MATLFGKKIKDTYKGLLKTFENQELDATLQDITDGIGQAVGIQVSTGDAISLTKRVDQVINGGNTLFGNNAGIGLVGKNGSCVAVGYNSLSGTGKGISRDVAIGSFSQQDSTGGKFGNTSVGAYSLREYTGEGGGNVAIGNSSQEAINSDMDGMNTSVGNESLFSNQNAFNTAIGAGCLRNNTEGRRNVGVGAEALVGVTTGAENVAVGRGAGNNIDVGGKNTLLGYTTSLQGTEDSRAIVIGHNAVGQGSNTAVIGDININALHLMKPGAAIVLRSADSTVYSITVSNAGVLVVA